MDESENNNRTENKRARRRPRDKQRNSEISREQDTSGKEVIKKVILDPFQKEALEWDGNLLLKTGRQVGKTFIMSQKAAKYMVNHPGSKIICCSLTEDQAQLIIIMTLDYLEKNYKNKICGGTKKPTKNKIELTNHSTIIARPVGNTGDAVRGFTGDVLILDECSRFAEFIFTASKPTLLTTGGKIWMCSTPFGKKGYFWEAYQNKNGRFKVIEANSWDVMHERPISEVWTQEKKDAAIRFLEDEQRDCSRLQFAQEYLGQFVEDLNQFFSDELIQQVCILKKRTGPIMHQKQYYLGVDIARMGEDKSSFEILDKINSETIEQVESITTSKTKTTDTFDEIIYLDNAYNFIKIGIDAGSGSLGVGILDFLLRSQVKRKVTALNNLSRQIDYSGKKKKTLMKEDMYQNMLAMLQSNILKLLDDDNVRLSLKSIQYEYINEKGKLTSIRIFASHHTYSDICEGLIRAAWLANTKSLNHMIDWV